MSDLNQGPETEIALAPVEQPAPAPTVWPWLVIVAAAGIAALIFGQAELALLAVMGGLFALAHASDMDPQHAQAYTLLAWVVPVASATGFLALSLVLASEDLPFTHRAIGLAGAGLGALFSVAAGFRPVAHAIARTLFGVETTSRVLRLAARLAVLATLFSIPAALSFPILMEQLRASGTSVIGGAVGLWGNLIGLVLLALGGVGFLVRRDVRATMDRLGLAPLRASDSLAILGGVAAMVALNAGAEWAQKTWLPALWENDQNVTRLIAGSLTRPEALLLGLSAGFGEEIALRGALQPRLGVFRTSMLFAVLHVQYSWFGMLLIALLGLFLGWIRQRSSTSVAIAVHVIYDVIAVLTVGEPPIGD